MLVVLEYVTHRTSGKTHLVASHPEARRTLCGLRLHEGDYLTGDETLSGLAATCERCRKQGRLS